MSKDKSGNLWFFLLFVGCLLFGSGISELSTAGSTNAILIFESARQPMLTEQFNRLHATLDTHIMVGALELFIGSLLISYSLLKMTKTVK